MPKSSHLQPYQLHNKHHIAECGGAEYGVCGSRFRHHDAISAFCAQRSIYFRRDLYTLQPRARTLHGLYAMSEIQYISSRDYRMCLCVLRSRLLRSLDLPMSGTVLRVEATGHPAGPGQQIAVSFRMHLTGGASYLSSVMGAVTGKWLRPIYSAKGFMMVAVSSIDHKLDMGYGQKKRKAKIENMDGVNRYWEGGYPKMYCCRLEWKNIL